ncbi:copper-translocating P-type ATPase [Stipitochalara longipes BDJ]|nr:copper-translocating P-type ATPase [Stipitochalara longipes BDJ]
MPPSCCKDKLGNPAETYATTASRPDEVSPPVSKLEVEDTCCTRDQVEPIAQTEAQKPVEHTKIVSPCVKCGDSSNPGQPCCDETCLVRIAVRECEDSCGSDGDFASTSSGYRDSGKGDDCCAKAVQSAKTKKGPCQRHMESAKSRFQPTLDALGCICRALFALNLESCCVKGQDSQRESRRSSARISSPHRLSAISLERAKGGGCCSVASPDPYKKPIEPDCKKGCCGRAMDSSCGNSILSTSCAKKCCSETSKQAIIRATSDNCCSGNSCSEEKEMSGAVASEVHLDLEKGILDGEHVVLSIQGMTCTGCETKLERTLANIPGISKIKTSLVLARAEFDVSTAQISVDEAVVRLQKATGFECQKLSRDGHELEILPPGISENLGARDIVEKAFDQQLTLALNRPDPSISAGNKHVWQVGLATLISACLTVPVLVLAWADLPEREITYGSVSLVLATIIQIFIAGPFYVAALKSLIFARVIEMDLLIVLSTSAAYIFSVVAFALLAAGKPLPTGEFFETGTLLVTLIMLGRFITALARQKAIESISIRSLQQSTAMLVEGDGTVTRDIDVRLLQYGDVFRVMPEAKVVTDGTVISGNSEIDESMITGESSLVTKSKGSPAIAGSVNGSGTLDVRLTRLCDDNTISTIANMVDEAKLSKPKTQEIADRVAGYFVPVVIVITIITLVIWIAVGIAIQKKSSSDATVQAVTYAIAVLIISCPCAIGLAVPMVIVIAGGVAADKGVIFKSANTIEAAKNVTHVVFDKTGTLTTGRLSVKESKYVDGLTEDMKPILLGLVSGIKHPVSQAIAEHLQSLGVSPATVLDTKSLPGKGVLGNWNGNQIRAGNVSWTQATSSPELQQFLTSGSTVLCFTVNNTLRAIYALRDTLRPEAAHVVSTLHAKGVSVSIVSGDETGAVQKTAESLGIPSSNSLSRCSPADKQAYIQTLKTSSANSTILFLGDGTNDAIALASADIGVHMSEGTDVARSAADVVLTHADLRGVLVLIELSRKAWRRIMFNFAWSIAYNLFAILLAAGAFVNFRVPPAFAGVGEIVSVLPVIAIAVGLRWAKVSA